MLRMCWWARKWQVLVLVIAFTFLSKLRAIGQHASRLELVGHCQRHPRLEQGLQLTAAAALRITAMIRTCRRLVSDRWRTAAVHILSCTSVDAALAESKQTYDWWYVNIQWLDDCANRRHMQTLQKAQDLRHSITTRCHRWCKHSFTNCRRSGTHGCRLCHEVKILLAAYPTTHCGRNIDR